MSNEILLFGFWNKTLFLVDRVFLGCKLHRYFLSAPKGNSYEGSDSYASARILQRFPSIWMGLLRTPGSSTGGAEATYAKCACKSRAATSRTTENVASPFLPGHRPRSVC